MFDFRKFKYSRTLLLVGIFLFSGNIVALAQPLVITDMPAVTVNCLSDVADSVTTCVFSKPSGITSIPSDLYLAIGSDVDPEGQCVLNNNQINCDGIPVGRINNSHIYARIGTGQIVQTGGNVKVLTIFELSNEVVDENAATQAFLNQFGTTQIQQNTLEDNTQNPDPTQTTTNPVSTPTNNSSGTGIILIRTGGAVSSAVLLLICVLVLTAKFYIRKKMKIDIDKESKKKH